jgi:hypothetical protein
MRCGCEQHHIGNNVVVVGCDGAALPVSEGQGIRGSGEDLGVAAGQDDGLENVRDAQAIESISCPVLLVSERSSATGA